uniref:Uncharacterized protein n=1 Tax=Pipistrellus kuhlii TaxID=59472 RepID=A0A7J7RT02_PIPKU|nr:hypothetical protein mPipKuh1_010372 [Pipistrellus kuhlii]
MFFVFRFKQELTSSSLRPSMRQELHINLMCNKIPFFKEHLDDKLYILTNIILKCRVWFSINFCEAEKLSCEVLCLGLPPAHHFLLDWQVDSGPLRGNANRTAASLISALGKGQRQSLGWKLGALTMQQGRKLASIPSSPSKIAPSGDDGVPAASP